MLTQPKTCMKKMVGHISTVITKDCAKDAHTERAYNPRTTNEMWRNLVKVILPRMIQQVCEEHC